MGPGLGVRDDFMSDVAFPSLRGDCLLRKAQATLSLKSGEAIAYGFKCGSWTNVDIKNANPDIVGAISSPGMPSPKFRKFHFPGYVFITNQRILFVRSEGVFKKTFALNDIISLADIEDVNKAKKHDIRILYRQPDGLHERIFWGNDGESAKFWTSSTRETVLQLIRGKLSA